MVAIILLFRLNTRSQNCSHWLCRLNGTQILFQCIVNEMKFQLKLTYQYERLLYIIANFAILIGNLAFQLDLWFGLFIFHEFI